MKALLYLNLTTKQISLGSGSWTPPVLTFRETLDVGLRFQKDIEDATREVSVEVNYLKASIGKIDERPSSGTYRIHVGDAPQAENNTTAPLPWNAGPAEIRAAINALTAITGPFGQVDVATVESSLLFKFGAGASNVALEMVDVQLEPPCIGFNNAWQVAGQWVQELRLIQTPVAFTDHSSRRLPDAPSVTRIQAGGTEGELKWNEIQQISIPPEFLGSYQFRWNNKRTPLLSRSDDVDAMAAALAVYGSGITVTNPRDQVARIEFGGNFAGEGQPLLEVVVADAPEGDLSFVLTLDKPPLAAMLRSQSSLTLPLELEIGIHDETAPGNVSVEKFTVDVTIQRGMLFGMLATAAGIDWLRPRPTDYIPFTLDQVIVGQLFYACALGNGEATTFVVDHNLNTETIAGVMVRENHADGRVLVLGQDYEVAYHDANSLSITVTSTVPTSAGLALVITAAGAQAVFQQHTHTMDQVRGLLGAFEGVIQRITTLEAYLPHAIPSLTTTDAPVEIVIPASSSVLFYTGDLSSGAAAKLAQLPARPPYLLPAVHQAGAAEALPNPLPAPSLNGLWSSASRLLIPGTGRIANSYADADGFVASDGRMLYPASRSGTTASYYPKPFEATLWEFPINDAQLAVGRTLDVQFSLTLRLVNATSEAQWVLVVEQGAPVSQADPENTEINLETIAWAADPILSQRVLLTPLAVTHSFGVRIQRGSESLTADKMRYGTWQPAGATAPANANFALRARLINFDTRNNVPNATGWLYYALAGIGGGDAKASIL